MRTLATFACAMGIAAVAALSTTTPSSADPAGAAIAGGVLGFMAGAALGSAPYYGPPPDYDYARPRYDGWRDHVAACEDDYGWRYDPRTDLVHLHGDVFVCDD